MSQSLTTAVTVAISERRPTRIFLLVFTNKDGTTSLYRTPLETLHALEARGGTGEYRWRYEVPGEGGVYPTMEEWNAIHGTGGCATPCQKCKRAGYDPITGRTIAGGLTDPSRAPAQS